MAGTFNGPSFNENDILTGSMFALRIDFVTDATDGTLPEQPFDVPFGSFLADMDFVSDETMTVGVEVQTIYGVVTHPNDTISLPQMTRYILTDRPSVIRGFKLKVTTAGTADAGKAGYVVLNFASNKR